MKDQPAFPLASTEYSDEYGFWSGLTKRELFAAMAMQGFVLHYTGYVKCNFDTAPDETAHRAVQYADALIEELEKGKQ